MLPADLAAELEARCGDLVADVGLFLDGPGGTTRAFSEGLRRGLAAVGITPVAALGPLVPADVANLSPALTLRVLDEAERLVWSRVLVRWGVVARAAGIPEFAPAAEDTTAGGFRRLDRQAITERKADLDAALQTPYRAAAPPIVINDPPRHRFGFGGNECWST